MVLKESQYVQKEWQSLKPGDIVKIEQDQELPADVFILHSQNSQGCCFVTTANLDGEANLKIKTSVMDLQNFIDNKGISKLKGVINFEK